VTGPLATLTIVVALLAAAWCGLAAARDRAPGRSHFAAAWLTEAVVVALVVTAVVQLATAGRDVQAVTFVGYLLTVVLLPPAGAVLARMEPTRWGSGILAVALLVVPVVVVRLQRVWEAAGG
jgi:hypothetical protein